MPYTNRLLFEADVILAVGFRFSDRTIAPGKTLPKETKVIHIDIDISEIGKNVEVDIPLQGDAKKCLKAILNLMEGPLQESRTSAWLRHVEELKRSFKPRESPETPGYLKPPRLMKELRDILPPNAIATTEVGQNQMWAAIYFKTYHPRTFISSGGLGAMGFGFPAALGAKVAKPEVPVVDIAGDGSFLMNEQELATSVKEGIPVTVIIIDNRMLGMVAQWQRALYQRRYSQVELGNTPDFVKLAEAYGAFGLRVGSYEEFRRAVREALKSDVTTVIDVPVSPEENVSPISIPGAPEG
jgi:acetolactate synthase-1/2/3 large subunit